MEENTPKKRGRGRPPLSPEEKEQRLKEQSLAKRERQKLQARCEIPTQPDILMKTEPGDNARYLAHAMAIMNMPKIDTKDPVQVEERIQWYLRHCIESDMKPTVKGFCNALGIVRNTLWEWKTGKARRDTHEELAVRAYDLLEEMWENYMQNGKINPVAGIFLGKNNFGYQDRQEYVLTPNQQQEVIDPATIEAKYAELPDVED